MESGRQKVYWQKEPPAPGAQAVPAGHVQRSAKVASLQVAPAPPHVDVALIFRFQYQLILVRCYLGLCIPDNEEDNQTILGVDHDDSERYHNLRVTIHTLNTHLHLLSWILSEGECRY